MQKDNWLEWRKQGVGASDATIIMGKAPSHWKINTPYKLWQHKLGLLENEMNSAMQRGKDHEEEAISWFQLKVGKCLFSQQCFEHPEHSWMRATFDAIDLDDEIAVEVKVSGRENFEIVKSGKVPEMYLPQVLYQMMVHPTKDHYFCVYCPEMKEGAYVLVEPHEAYTNEIKAACEDFWNCVVTQTAPKLTHRDFLEKEDDESWMNQAKFVARCKMEYEELEEKREIAKLKYEEAKKALAVLTDDQSAEGGGFKLKKIVSKGRISYSKIPLLQEMDLEIYRGNPSVKFDFTYI